MFYPALGVGIVLAPQPDELVQMMRPQYGPVPGQIIKVVHDDGDEQIDDQERAQYVERDKIRESEIGSATVVVGLISTVIAEHFVWPVSTRHHDVLPSFTCAREREQHLQ